MKKVILSVLVAGSLLATSCKKAKEAGKDLKEGTEKVANEVKEGAEKVATDAKEGAEKVVEEVKEAVSEGVAGVAMPEFKDASVNEYVKTYTTYVKDLIEAKSSKDVAKISELGAKAQELSKSGQTAFAKLTDPAESKKLSDYITALNQKLAGK